jgi:hypothetical protein
MYECQNFLKQKQSKVAAVLQNSDGNFCQQSKVAL